MSLCDEAGEVEDWVPEAVLNELGCLPAVPRQHAKVRAKTPPAPSDPRSYAKLRALRPKISEAERAFEASVGAARASSDARIAAHADQYGARDAAGEARVGLRELGAARSSQYAASAAAHAHALATRRLEVRCGCYPCSRSGAARLCCVRRMAIAAIELAARLSLMDI